MLENIDIYALENSKKILDLKDYKYDGTLSYCDFSDLEVLLKTTQDIIDKTIIARQNNNYPVLKRISAYTDNTLVRATAVNFYEERNLYSKCYYFLTQMKKMTIYNIENVSLIPETINLTGEEDNVLLNIRDLYKDNNADVDMLFDKIIMTFYKYFHTGQILINDGEMFTYAYSLMSETCTPREKIFYNYLKNVGFLYSSFVVLDRIFQLQRELKYYEKQKEYYLAETQYIDASSWLSEPRLSNVKNLESMINEVFSETHLHRLILLIRKHIDYLDTVKNLNPGVI